MCKLCVKLPTKSHQCKRTLNDATSSAKELHGAISTCPVLPSDTLIDSWFKLIYVQFHRRRKKFYDLDTSIIKVVFQIKGAKYLGNAAERFLIGQQASVKLAK